MKKVALVTGANRGIGRAIAEGLVEKGYEVLLGCRDMKSGQEAAKEIGATPVYLDLREPTTIAKVANDYPNIDILVNNGALLHQGAVLTSKREDLVEAVDVNLLGAIDCIRAFAPGMVEKGFGRIVNVSSGWGSFSEGLDGPAPYSITKAALNAVTVVTAKELPQSVKINTVCPGWVQTRMGGEHAPKSVQEGAETILWLATLPDDGPTGKFFRDKVEIEF